MTFMKRFSLPALALTAAFVTVPMLQLGCSSNDGVKDDPQTTRDGGSSSRGDGGSGGGDCVTNPKTSEELLNACTDAVKVEKQPNLPLLGPNGERPALP
ncbi:hypothetical protein [Pendulispora albinea]|uniref:Secreted protein n=1 Tax=Pendulispora albinea TaxID=2741071 RepID=A0ABZ2LPT3_9BACT